MATSVFSSVRPVFVLGCPRSGTTLLQPMLHARPRIAPPPETRFVLSAYERRLGFGDLREPVNRAALAHWITGRRETLFCELGLDAEDVVGRITGGPPTLGSALGIALKAYADSHGKARWGDKRPACALHVEESCGSSRTPSSCPSFATAGTAWPRSSACPGGTAASTRPSPPGPR
ncbi:sulfotransferase [Streptomyces sp. R39]|uniref:Sulfotransferase n=1 Tax=Streptomyces sp. R39 TaxID=3238631 RepID=A0AB39QJE2_9ACTN